MSLALAFMHTVFGTVPTCEHSRITRIASGSRLKDHFTAMAELYFTWAAPHSSDITNLHGEGVVVFLISEFYVPLA